MFPLEIGAVVLGVPRTCHTPLSGQDWPVLAVVPKGALVCILIYITGFLPAAYLARTEHSIRSNCCHQVLPLKGIASMHNCIYDVRDEKES